MIVTAQPFLNELDLLEVKFAELEGSVDLHIVVESTKTFTGIDKRLYYLSCAERFAKYPVHHVIVDLPDTHSPWEREKTVHLRIASIIENIGPDVVIYCDADEVPRRAAIERFLESEMKTARLSMHHLNYFFDRRVNWMGWDFAKIHRFTGAWQPCRSDRDFPLLPDAGWHFQNMIGDDCALLMEKLKATSHAPDSEANGFTRRIESGELVDIQHTDEFTDLPRFVLENKERFQKYFMP